MDALTRAKNIDFLTLPTEVRLAIYRCVFQDLTVPLLCDFAAGPRNDGDGGRHDSGHTIHRRTVRIGMWPTTTAIATSPLETKTDQYISILFVCRKTYDEARGVFFRTSSFELQSLSEEDQGSVIPSPETAASPMAVGPMTEPCPYPSPTGPLPLPTSQIQHLSIPHSLLTTYPPDILRSLFPSLTVVHIRQITIPLAHNKLSSLAPDLQTLHQSTALARGDSPKHDIEHSPGLRLFRTLLCEMAVAVEGDQNQQVENIMAHYAACHGRYALVLHFVLRCRHVGLHYVPGLFPFRRNPHQHSDEEVTYTFNAGTEG